MAEVRTIRPPEMGTNPVVVSVPMSIVAYDHIPTLRELLPRFHGIPGLYYLQVSVVNQTRAESEGWREVANSVTYKIVGPKGECDVRLYCMGEPIPGACHLSGKRTCEVDLEIRKATGHWDGSASKPEPPKGAENAAKPQQGQKKNP